MDTKAKIEFYKSKKNIRKTFLTSIGRTLIDTTALPNTTTAPTPIVAPASTIVEPAIIPSPPPTPTLDETDLEGIQKLATHLQDIYKEAKKWNVLDFDVCDLVCLSFDEYEVLKSYRKNLEIHQTAYMKTVIEGHKQINEKKFNTKTPVVKAVKKVVIKPVEKPEKPKKTKTLFD